MTALEHLNCIYFTGCLVAATVLGVETGSICVFLGVLVVVVAINVSAGNIR